MKLAGLFLVLAVLAALVRIGGGAEARSLAARVPDTMFFPERRETPAPMRWTEDRLAALEDMRSAPRPPDGTTARPAGGPGPKTESPTRTNGGRAGKQPPVRGLDARAVPAAWPPVFYRPAGSAPRPASGPVCGDLRGAPEGARIVFPLERRFFYSYEDTWGAPRAQGGHEGTDLMTPSGVPEYAITDGTVVPVAGSNAGGWNTLGGHAVMVRADYSMGPVREGDLFYYAHLERKSPLEVGSKIRAGQVVGYAGDTGQGPPGTSGLFPPHLHLGWYDGTGGREQATSGAMNPYPLLEWIKSNGGAVSGGSDARFCEAPRTGPPNPSAHDGAWPKPSNPDLTPDLDSGPNERNASNKRPDRDGKKPKGKPARTDRDDGDRRKDSQNHDRNRDDKPDRPKGNPRNPMDPDPGEDRKPPSKPRPPREDPGKPDPPKEPSNGGQYDPATGGEVPPPDRPTRPEDREPSPAEKDDVDKDTGDPGEERGQPGPDTRASTSNEKAKS